MTIRWTTRQTGLARVAFSGGVLLLLLGACGSSRQRPCQPEDAARFSDSSRMEEIVGFLASDELGGRNTGTVGAELAASYLEDRLRQYGIAPYFGSYRDTLSNVGETAYNVVGFIPGSDPQLAREFVVLGAHYDHIGRVAPVAADSIANGANDNATGTATALELARYFSGCRPPARSLLIVFFGAEERGLLGSVHLAAKLKEQGFLLNAMLNFEMTGVPMAGREYQVYLTGFGKSNLAEVANGFASENLVGLLPEALEYNLFQRSDNYSFFNEFRVPAHTFSTFDFSNYGYYHLPGDEASRMDYGHMSALLNKLIPVVQGIANAPAGTLKLN